VVLFLHSPSALQLLHDCHSNSPVPSLLGTQATVDYLQLLGRDNFALIKKYSKWVLEMDAEAGLKVECLCGVF
jgi:hypothetical protein